VRPIPTLVCCVAAVLLLAGTAAGTGASASAAKTSAPCGRASHAPTWRHVIVIVMENHGYSQVHGHSPALDRLAASCGVATGYRAISHPSLPNYIALTSGGTQGISDDCSPSPGCSPAVPSIFGQVGADWKSYAEAMPSPCYRESSGDYSVRHNPAVYYSQLTTCSTNDVPLGTFAQGALHHDLAAGTLPRFAFVTPDRCHDEHDCSVAEGDAWLGQLVRRIVATRNYRAGDTALFITYDEDDGDEDNRVTTVVVSPSTHPGRTVSAAFTHYSLLRTVEQMLGLPCLGQACSAPSMRRAFGL
jgi:phosphatidylinositol-3-phosphatase